MRAMVDKKRLLVTVLRRHATLQTPEHRLWFGVIAQTVNDCGARSHNSRMAIERGGLKQACEIVGLDHDFFLESYRRVGL